MTPVATAFLDQITTFFTWIIARMGELFTFVMSQEMLVYLFGIILISFVIGVIVRLIRNRA